MPLHTDFSRLTQSRSPLAAAISLVLGAASPGVVHAQEAAGNSASPVLAAAAEGQSTPRQNRRRSGTLEEVTVEGQKYRNEVSSPKYTAELVDVPQTVVVIPKAVFREQAAITLSDVLRNTPGITLLAGEGGGASNTAGDSFFMRGFDATNSIFIDGVRDQGAYSRDVFNLDQVEVSKGPSGSYTGRGNASGSVNLVTKTPFEEPLRAVGLSYGTNDHVRSTVDINQPLPEDFLGGSAVRLNAMWQDGGVAGRDEVERDAWGIAPSFALGLGTDTRLAVAAQILRQESTPDYGLPSAALPGLAPTTPPVGHVDQNNFYGIAGVDFDDIDSDSYTARIEHDFAPGVTLRNLTRYSDNHRLAVVTVIQNPAAFDPLTGLVTRARQINERINRNFTNQTNLNFEFRTGSLSHSMSTGVEYAKETQINPGRTGAGTAPPADIYQSESARPGHRLRARAHGCVHGGRDDDGRSLRLRHDRAEPAVAGVGGRPRGALRHGLPERRDPWIGHGRHQARRVGHADELERRRRVQAGRQRQYLPLGGDDPDAARRPELHVVADDDQREQSGARAAEVDELRARHEVGRSRWAPVDDRGRVPHGQHERRHERDDRRHGRRRQLRQRAASRRHRARRSAG